MKQTQPFSHTESKVIGFFGSAKMLSNFHPSKIKLWGFTFEDGEAAFQAAKLADPLARGCFVGLAQGSAKRLGRTVKLRSDWEKVKSAVMEEVVYAKFSQNPELETFLLETGEAHLEERNFWKDRVWGTDVTGQGENRLGKILMSVRARLKARL